MKWSKKGFYFFHGPSGIFEEVLEVQDFQQFGMEYSHRFHLLLSVLNKEIGIFS